MPLHYQRQAQTSGPHDPILLLHGLFGSLDNLNSLARSLSPHCEVISIDLPNHGRSPAHQSFDYATMAATVFELSERLGIERFNLLGHSMGGKVAMQMALTDPSRINKLIVADISPVTYQPSHNQVFDALQQIDLSQITSRRQADELMRPLIGEPGIRAFLLKSLVLPSAKSAHWRFNLSALIDNYPKLSLGLQSDNQYQGPTLFIKGQDSDYIQPQHRPVIAGFFPNSRAHQINQAGHWLHAEKPQQFNRIVERFLFARST